MNKNEANIKYKNTTKEEVRMMLEKTFSGKELISRHDPSLNAFMAAGSLANADCRGEGIEGRVVIAKGIFYPVPAVINWLVSKVKEPKIGEKICKTSK